MTISSMMPYVCLIILIPIVLYFVLNYINYFSNTESFASFNMSDYIPSDWEQSPTGFGRNTTGCGSNPDKIWEIKSAGDVKDVNDDLENNQLILINGLVDVKNVGKKDDMKISVKNKKNITIIGINDAVFTGSISVGGSSNNVIIRNIFFEGMFEDGDTEDSIKDDKNGDLVTIKGEDIKNIWVDHCTFIKSADGLLDMTNGATNITVSWCILGDPTKSRNRKDGNSSKKSTTHHKVMLIGAGDHSDGGSDEERDMKVQITIHHCWFPGNSRNPRIRYARPIHLYNNFYDQNSMYTIAARQKTISLSENSFFYRSGRPYDTEKGGTLYVIGDKYQDTCVENPPKLHLSEHTSAKLSNCTSSLMAGGGDEPGPDSNLIFQKDSQIESLIDYDYNLDDADQVPELVTSTAGAGGKGFSGYTLMDPTTGTTTNTGTATNTGTGAFQEASPAVVSPSEDSKPESNGSCNLRPGGIMKNNTCYYKYGDSKVCEGIKWKKCDATRGDKKGEPDSGRYVIDGSKITFCKLDESKGEESDGECVADWSENAASGSNSNSGSNSGSNSNNQCTERPDGVMRNNTCYYKYTDQNTCTGIKWKKCDATRGDKKGDTDSGRYVIDGNKMVFCKLDESKGEESDGECVSDWTEDIASSSSASINYNSSKTSLDDEADNLRKQISFIQQNI